MKQDEKEFSPISEGKPESLLQQAADGNLVLFAAARRHTAKLHAFPWVEAPKQSSRGCAAGLVPIMRELANDLILFPDSQLKRYLAIDPTDCPDAHPLEDHYWVMDEPQTITREQIYFQSAPAASGRIEDPRIRHVKALNAAALPALSLHGLRRSFGTLSEWVEVPAGIVAQIMGHKPSAIAEKHYIQRELDLLHLWHIKIEAWILEQAEAQFEPKKARILFAVK